MNGYVSTGLFVFLGFSVSTCFWELFSRTLNHLFEVPPGGARHEVVSKDAAIHPIASRENARGVVLGVVRELL